MKTVKLGLAIGIILYLTTPRLLLGAEAYVIGFRAESQITYGSCLLISWTPDLTLHNTGSQEARVKLLSLSNGILPSQTTEITVLPHRTISGRLLLGQTPAGQLPFLWVARLDIPESVLAQSRVEASPANCGRTSPPEPPWYGAFALPVTRSLTPPNAARVHLGADLGIEDAYVNVGIYNAGVQPAHANVELRRACDDSIVESRSITIPPDSIIQLSGLDGPLTSCATGTTPGSGWVRYVTVTVDQPSLSYVVNKLNELPDRPSISYGSSCSP
jgi:hypothetical protein